MGMPITLEIIDPSATESAFDEVFDYFTYIDQKFSTYKQESEISQINRRELLLEESSEDMILVFGLAEQTKQETNGYFNIQHKDIFDPSGVVKGWAIYNAAQILRQWIQELLCRGRRGYSGVWKERGGRGLAHRHSQSLQFG